MKAAARRRLQRVAGIRVNLRTLHEQDLVAIEIWYEEAARAAYEDRGHEELRHQADAERAGLMAIERANEEEPIGLLEYVVIDGWLVTTFIALAKGHRGWGYGSESVRLLEEWAAREVIATRFRAEVDLRNGLGLYFWLRLGYRPATVHEFDWQRNEARDKMPMVRVAN